jgi:hypothetical protein
VIGSPLANPASDIRRSVAATTRTTQAGVATRSRRSTRGAVVARKIFHERGLIG